MFGDILDRRCDSEDPRKIIFRSVVVGDEVVGGVREGEVGRDAGGRVEFMFVHFERRFVEAFLLAALLFFPYHYINYPT